MDDKAMQKKYVEYKLFQDQLKQTQKQLQLLEEQVVEIVYAHQSLDELKRIKKARNDLKGGLRNVVDGIIQVDERGAAPVQTLAPEQQEFVEKYQDDASVIGHFGGYQ